ncbi:hypothetical protein RISK_003345 [Rhodopirellula islandica]|uniref:Uncharacterized protein n=1 Tax=Rhodopirellula islandica TaxID=595434 RepID=A0A0J1BDM4_RHOIS|nr:hypothetical protein RISK_003345 [Rhodopirellula islandica]
MRTRPATSIAKTHGDARAQRPFSQEAFASDFCERIQQIERPSASQRLTASASNATRDRAKRLDNFKPARKQLGTTVRL